jgi:hypothetical protein
MVVEALKKLLFRTWYAASSISCLMASPWHRYSSSKASWAASAKMPLDISLKSTRTFKELSTSMHCLITYIIACWSVCECDACSKLAIWLTPPITGYQSAMLHILSPTFVLLCDLKCSILKSSNSSPNSSWLCSILPKHDLLRVLIPFLSLIYDIIDSSYSCYQNSLIVYLLSKIRFTLYGTLTIFIHGLCTHSYNI